MCEPIFGLDSAVKEAREIIVGNMTVSAGIILECQERIDEQAELIKQQAKEIEALTAERQRRLNFDALNKRIDSYFT